MDGNKMESKNDDSGDKKVGFIFCVCTGKCPGFKDMDMWDFINTIRATYPVEYAFIHPMLCDEDGDRFFQDFLRKDRRYFIAGCAPIMQRKLFRDAFARTGLDINQDLVSLDVRNMTTQKALETVKKTLEEAVA
jgi:heterodisulfide reductase subunit A-like polyferredoxin